MAKFRNGNLILSTGQSIYLDSIEVIDQSRQATLTSLRLDASLSTVITSFTTDGGLSGDSDAALPTEKAVRDYVAAYVASAVGGAISPGVDNSIARYDGTDIIQGSSVTLDDLNNLTGINHLSSNSFEIDGGQAYYTTEIDNGSSGVSSTIDWSAGNNHKITLTGNCTFTFTPPSGITHMTMKIVQDITGSRTVTWPVEVLWPGGFLPVLTATPLAIDIFSFYYDGVNYYGSYSPNFS